MRSVRLLVDRVGPRVKYLFVKSPGGEAHFGAIAHRGVLWCAPVARISLPNGSYMCLLMLSREKREYI